jgi:hypothetical protein
MSLAELELCPTMGPSFMRNDRKRAGRRERRSRTARQGRTGRFGLRRALSWLAGAAVLAVLAHGALVNLGLISVSFESFEMRKSPPIEAFEGVRGMGQANAEHADSSSLAQVMALKGNLLLHIRAANRDEASKTYYHLVYLLYPKRVYVCEANRTVGYLPEADFRPGSEWAREHDVQWVMQTAQRGGGYGYQVDPYGAPTRGTGAGGPAGKRP